MTGRGRLTAGQRRMAGQGSFPPACTGILGRRGWSRDRWREPEPGQQSGAEAGYAADLAAREGEHHHPGRVETGIGRCAPVHAECGLAVGPGRDEPDFGAGPEYRGAKEPGGCRAALVFERGGRHGQQHVAGQQGDQAADVMGLIGPGQPGQQRTLGV